MDRKEKAQVKDISKKIKKELETTQDLKDMREFKGNTSNANIKTRKTKHLITHMRNEGRDIEASRREIADTFAPILRRSLLK